MLYIKIAKYILAVLGGFLLAVEAIKIRNLRIFSNYIRKFVASVYPVLKWMAGEEERLENTLSRSGIISLHVLAVLLGTPVWIVLEVGGSLGGTFHDFFNQYLSFGRGSDESLIVQLGNIIGVLIGGYAAGVLIIGILVELLSIITKVMTWIENNTESGVVGIFGFLLFLLSVILDVIDNQF
jgi:hypothetical protein